MTIQKQIANRILANLDKTADQLDVLAKAGKVDPRLASILVRDLDTFADKFQVAAFGKDALARYRGKVAKVLEGDADEKATFLKTFDNPNKVITRDPDEDWLNGIGASFNAKAIKNFDQDRTTTVTDRDEFNVRDLSEWADKTTKQPSWAKGPAGKSTVQGSTAPKSGKTWSP